MNTHFTRTLVVALALTVGAVSMASAARVGNNGGNPGGPSGPSGTGHGAQDLVIPGSCKEWRYFVVDGAQKRECKIYNYNYSK